MEEGTSGIPGHSAVTTDPGTSGPDTEQDWAIDQWYADSACEVREILDRVADKWSLLVISLLERRTMRFNELRRSIDKISQRMLAVTLRQLERDGLVQRMPDPGVPPKVEYRLTDLGCSLLEPIKALVDWTETHQRDIAAARTAYDDDRRVQLAGSDQPRR